MNKPLTRPNTNRVLKYQHKFTYFMRTIPNISTLLKRLDVAIDEFLLKPIMNNYNFKCSERLWYSLPPRMGGLGVIIPSEVADIYHQNSRDVTADLVKRIVQQNCNTSEDQTIEQQSTSETRSTSKHAIRAEKNRRNEEKSSYVKSTLTPQSCKLLEAITETGASNWLTTMPLKEHGFYLSKQVFWDSINLRYGIQLADKTPNKMCLW